MQIKKHIPNFLTLCNLSCGVVAIVFAYHGLYTQAGWMFLLGVGFDFFDGFAARMLHVKSEMGKELDSLADCITSGLLPTTVMFTMMKTALAPHLSDTPVWESFPVSPLALAAAPSLLIVLFSALRLAKFNLDTRQTDSFIGLPTPACGLIVVFLPFLAASPVFSVVLSSYWVLAALTVALSLLLVCELPLFALKFKSFGWTGNQKRWVLLAVSALLIVTMGFRAFPLAIVVYLLMSLVFRERTAPAK